MTKSVILSVVFAVAILIEIMLVRALRKDIEVYRSPWELQ